jgi:hypothetical protein
MDLSLTLLGAIGHLEHFSFTNKPHISALAGGLPADSFLEGFTKPRPMRILSFRLSKSVKTSAFLPQRPRTHTHARTHKYAMSVYISFAPSLSSYTSYTSPSPRSLYVVITKSPLTNLPFYRKPWLPTVCLPTLAPYFQMNNT